jgi:hypothetical protein
MGDDRPIRYLDPDGTVVYRASGLGACDGVILGLAAGRRPAQTPDWLMEIFNEGHEAEPFILARLIEKYDSDHDVMLELDTQNEWELEIGEINDRRVIIRSHSDGYDFTNHILVEAKKFRPSTYPKFQRQGVECNPNYPWQLSVMMHSIHQLNGLMPEALFVGGRYEKEEGDDSPIGEVEWHTYPDPPIPFKDIRKRIARWENMIGDGLDVTDLTTCSTRMYPCAMFGKGCPSEAEDDTVELEGEHAEVAALLGEQWAVQQGIITTAKRMIEEAEKKKKALREGIEGLLDDIGEDHKKMTAGGYKFNHITGEVPPKEVKGYSLDYWKITPPKKETPTS